MPFALIIEKASQFINSPGGLGVSIFITTRSFQPYDGSSPRRIKGDCVEIRSDCHETILGRIFFYNRPRLLAFGCDFHRKCRHTERAHADPKNNSITDKREADILALTILYPQILTQERRWDGHADHGVARETQGIDNLDIKEIIFYFSDRHDLSKSLLAIKVS